MVALLLVALTAPPRPVPVAKTAPLPKLQAPVLSIPALGPTLVPAAPPVLLSAPSSPEPGKTPQVNWDGAPERAPLPDPVPEPPRAELPRPSLLARVGKPLAAVAAGVATMAVLDIGVLEGIVHPLHESGVPWESFLTNVFGHQILTWWLYFIPATFAVTGLTGWLAARWRGALAGMLLFATGLEDILYYWLRLSSLPGSLGWLNDNPLIAWTRWATGTADVSGTGLLISAAAGLAAAVWLLSRRAR